MSYIYYVCHIFVHFFVTEHIGWFHSFAIVNSTAINTDMSTSVMLSWNPLDKCSRVGSLGHMIEIFSVL